MTEKELNKQHIRNKLQGICQDCMWFEKTIPVINKMLSEAYISGFEQGKFDTNMDLQQRVEQLENIRKEAIEYIDKNLEQEIITGEEYFKSYSPCTDLLNILNKGSESDEQ